MDFNEYYSVSHSYENTDYEPMTINNQYWLTVVLSYELALLYKVELFVADMDRHYYETHSVLHFIVAGPDRW